MNHIKNIKEMLNIPTGSRNVATSSYCSLPDTQFFFGSQFWPENSQGTSQDVSISSRASQQSSEGSESKFINNYLTKPFLFGELKDKNKHFGMLDKFEEDKKRATENVESKFFAKECHNFWKALDSIQQLVKGTQRNTDMCQSVLEKIDNFTSTLQNSLNSLERDISQQFETLLNKVNSQKEMMTDLEARVQKSGEVTAELSSNLESMKKSLHCLREDQERKQNMVEEVLRLLNILVNEPSAKAERAMDISIQTSPGLEQTFCEIVPDNKLDDIMSTCVSNKLNNSKAKFPPQCPSQINGKKKFSLRGQRCKKRPLVLSQGRKHTVVDENCQPLMNYAKQQKVSEQNTLIRQDSVKPDCLKQSNRERTGAGGSFITPLSCWSQDSNSSVCLPEIEPTSGKPSAESRKGTSAKAEGLWQLFDMDSDSALGF